MSFVKKRWLVLTALVAMLCVSLGTILVIRASAPVEPKRVYLLPKSNPARAEILKRASQPARRTYAPGKSNEVVLDDTSDETELCCDDSSSREYEFDEAHHEISADLKLKRSELDEWTADLNAQYPDLAYAQALVRTYEELLKQVSDRNEQLQNRGVSENARRKRLAPFVKNLIPSLMKKHRVNELYINLMRENIRGSVELNRYLRANAIMPLPGYLLGEFAGSYHHNH